MRSAGSGVALLALLLLVGSARAGGELARGLRDGESRSAAYQTVGVTQLLLEEVVGHPYVLRDAASCHGPARGLFGDAGPTYGYAYYGTIPYAYLSYERRVYRRGYVDRYHARVAQRRDPPREIHVERPAQRHDLHRLGTRRYGTQTYRDLTIRGYRPGGRVPRGPAHGPRGVRARR